MSILDHIRQFPHCDQRVLHAPEDNCEYCNKHPEWQALREAWGIAFTGHSFDKNGKLFVDEYDRVTLPCPAEAARGMKSLNSWHGNIPMTPEASKEMDEHFAKLNEGIAEFIEQRKKDIAEHTGEDFEI